MSSADLIQIIGKQPILKPLQEKHITLLADCAHTERFEKGSYLAKSDTPANAFFIILKGRVAIELPIANKGALVIQTLLPDELFGWSWIFPPFEWQFDGRALETVEALVFNGACLRGKCEKDSELGYLLMKQFAYLMAKRLKATRLQVLDIYGAK